MTVTRRAALSTLFAGGVASCASSPKLTPYVADTPAATGTFSSGVASGDPRADRVVIWTRIGSTGGEALRGTQTVTWQMARDDSFTRVVSEGTQTTGVARDGTVKVDVTGLEPGAVYFYRFQHGSEISPTGRTRTLPVGPLDRARFAVVSCSNYPFGYFNVYDQIARQDDLDAVLHLGDYIYEYGYGSYGDDVGERLGRRHAPGREIITLDDYRRRHRQYKSDPSSQAMHAAHPLIPIWDDHETSNNSWKDGAQNHTPETEGDWETRRRAALQAYYEWMPVRDPQPGRPWEAFFRSFSFGNLLTLSAIETRLMARVREINRNDFIASLQSPADVERFRRDVLNDPTREMLGAAQLQYLSDVMGRSKQAGEPWRLVANQIIMGRVIAPDLTKHVTEEQIVELEQEWDQARAFVKASTLGLPANFDAWDGYPAARERFYDMVRAQTDAEGMIVVTGDTHTWWANDLTNDSGAPMGVELGVCSVTSPTPYGKRFLGGKGAEYGLLTNRENKDVRYLNGEGNGFIDLEIGRSSATATFRAVDNIESTSYNAYRRAAFEIKKDRTGIAKFGRSKGLGFKEGFLY